MPECLIELLYGFSLLSEAGQFVVAQMCSASFVSNAFIPIRLSPLYHPGLQVSLFINVDNPPHLLLYSFDNSHNGIVIRNPAQVCLLHQFKNTLFMHCCNIVLCFLILYAGLLNPPPLVALSGSNKCMTSTLHSTAIASTAIFYTEYHVQL
jgi:hypothetical protein